MQNEKVLIEEVDKSCVVRIELDEVHHVALSTLKKIFKLTFDKSGNIFKRLNDLFYYKGGYPKEQSLPKITNLLDDIGSTFQFFYLLDEEDSINSYLTSKYGIRIAPMNEDLLNLNVGDIEKLDKFKKFWKRAFDEDYETLSKKEILEKLINRGQEIQSIICKLADSIKINAAEKVEKECDVKKRTFLPLVSLKAKFVKSESDEKVKKQVEDINKNNSDFNDALHTTLPEIS